MNIVNARLLAAATALSVLLTLLSPLIAQELEPARGLAATYSDGSVNISEIVASPTFFLESAEAPHTALRPQFEARFSGLLSVLRNGSYQFFCDGCDFQIAGRPAAAAPVELAPGRHLVEIRYQRKPGPAEFRIEWSSDHFPREPIPASAWLHDRSQAPSAQSKRVEEGRFLYEEFGCANCHSVGSGQLEARPGPILSGAGSWINSEWFYPWLSDPQKFREGARMPAMLADDQRRDVAAFLASLSDPSLTRDGKEPNKQDINRGRSQFQSIGCVACHQQPGLALEGLGSKFDVFALAAFLREPARRHPDGRMPSLQLNLPDSLELAGYLTETNATEFERPRPQGEAASGRQIIQSSGCLACHELTDGAQLSNQATAPKLSSLSPGGGCLADQPSAGVPRFALSSEQREALAAFVSFWAKAPDLSPAPAHSLRRDLDRLRCRACHDYEGVGPLASLAQAAPVLTGIGGKLKTDWLHGVITGGNRAHEWLELRMPQYYGTAAAHLAENLAKAEGVSPGEGPSPPKITDTLVDSGHGMLGTNPKTGGLGCIGCHDWGEKPSLGEHGPQLVSVAERMRYDWFHRWMRDPARILTGTSMPNYFGTLPPEESRQKIDDLWAAMSRGNRLRIPEGFQALENKAGSEALPLPTATEAAVIRWDMPEATPAAIAVGLPGGVSYCFDAGESRLRYAWLGGFVDLSITLFKKTNRGTGLTETTTLIGDIFYRTDGFPFRVGSPTQIPQRRFRGYRLIDGFPEFRYDVDSVQIEERVAPTEKGDGIVRQFKLSARPQPLWFEAASPSDVSIKSEGATIENGLIEIPPGGPATFTVIIRKR